MSPSNFLETLVQLNASLEPPKTQPELINVYVEKLNTLSSNQLFKDLINTWQHLNDMSHWLQDRYTLHQEMKLGFFAPGYIPPAVTSIKGSNTDEDDDLDNLDPALGAITDNHTQQNKTIPPEIMDM